MAERRDLPSGGTERSGGRIVGREHWTSRFGFITAAVGSAVGLGNIWAGTASLVEGPGVIRRASIRYAGVFFTRADRSLDALRSL